MPRLVWLTDLHLNFVLPERYERLKYEIAGRQPDALLVGGDTGEANSWRWYVKDLAASLGKPVYFVLGNHDFYQSSIGAVRENARELSRDTPGVKWLPEAGVIPLGNDTALVGHDGWGDARTPEYRTSTIVLNDYLLIEELREAAGADRLTADRVLQTGTSLLTPGLQDALQRLGDDAGDHLRRVLPEAAAVARHIVVLTHVPPFREACWHDGRLSDDNWAPHFTCVAAGTALAEFARDHPEHRMTVLCGHTHSAGTAQVLPNLLVLTGGARYGEPQVQQALVVL